VVRRTQVVCLDCGAVVSDAEESELREPAAIDRLLAAALEHDRACEASTGGGARAELPGEPPEPLWRPRGRPAVIPPRAAQRAAELRSAGGWGWGSIARQLEREGLGQHDRTPVRSAVLRWVARSAPPEASGVG
jgi:hypothetical protein